MENIFKRLDSVRFLRNVLFFFSLLLCVVGLIVNHLLIKQQWLYAMIVFDDLLILIILFFLIELKIGNKYENLYRSEFIPLVVKTINPSYAYESTPGLFEGDLLKTKIFDYDSRVKINHLVRFNDHSLYEAQIYIHTYRSNKMVQFNGYIILVVQDNIETTEGLILYHKKPLMGSYTLDSEFNFKKYRVYRNHYNSIPYLEPLKQVLFKYQKSKFYICLQDDIVIFKSNRKSFFNKPIFRKINQSFFETKKNQFKELEQMVHDFVLCFQ